MVTRKLNKKARCIDFYVDGTFVRSADFSEAAAVEAELVVKAHKAAALR